MRVPVSALSLMLAVVACVSAQMPPAAKAPTQADLDRYLLQWEKKMGGLTSMSAVIARIDKDKVFKSETKYTGWAAYMKSGTGATALTKACLVLNPDGKKDVIADKIICTGTYLYKFEPGKKQILSVELPKPKAGEVTNGAALGLMFGMKADVAKARFGLTLFKEDANYIYVDVTPKTSEDKVEFQRARLVLYKETFLPRQVWMEQANGNEVLWDLPRVAPGAVLDPRLFNTPTVPPGWKIVPINKTAPGAPRVIRGRD